MYYNVFSLKSQLKIRKNFYLVEQMVHLTGLEPARECSRQPLKLMRLPIPPQVHVVRGVGLEPTKSVLS